jgi:hypothetical protein
MKLEGVPPKDRHPVRPGKVRHDAGGKNRSWGKHGGRYGKDEGSRARVKGTGQRGLEDELNCGEF